MRRPFSFAEIDDSFFEESLEMLDQTAALIIAAERQRNVTPVISEVFRTFHSIKGGAQLIGCDILAAFAHKLEDWLDQIRTGQRPADMQVAANVLDAIALMEEEIRIYRGGEHPDEFAGRQEQLLEKIGNVLLPHEASLASPGTAAGASRAAADGAEAAARDDKRLVFLLFTMDEAAPMPDITEMLVLQRLQAHSGVLHFQRAKCGDGGGRLEAVVLTSMQDGPLRKASYVADIGEIQIRELTYKQLGLGCVLPEALEEFHSYIRKLDEEVNHPESPAKQMMAVLNDLQNWGEHVLACSSCFSGSASEWRRTLELLRTGILLWNQLGLMPEPRHLLAQLVQNLWECVYTRLDNKHYFFSFHPMTLGGNSAWLEKIRELILGTTVRILILDLSDIRVLETEDLATLAQTINWLKEQGILPAIVASGEFQHRHRNIIDTLSPLLGGLTIHSSAYNACIANFAR